MCQRYISGSASSRDILCFARGGNVWAVEVAESLALLNAVTYTEKRSGGVSLRYRPNKAQQDLILSNALRVEILCSVEYLEAVKADYNNNRGDAVEAMTARRWNGIQPKARNTKFTDCGDFNANGIEYQVKYGAKTGAATVTDEKTLNNLGL
jgi:hypothetical protein